MKTTKLKPIVMDKETEELLIRLARLSERSQSAYVRYLIKSKAKEELEIDIIQTGEREVMIVDSIRHEFPPYDDFDITDDEYLALINTTMAPWARKQRKLEYHKIHFPIALGEVVRTTKYFRLDSSSTWKIHVSCPHCHEIHIHNWLSPESKEYFPTRKRIALCVTKKYIWPIPITKKNGYVILAKHEVNYKDGIYKVKSLAEFNEYLEKIGDRIYLKKKNISRR